jgi:hypothetical protein
MSKNPPLAIRTIQQNLNEALGELEDLWAHIQLAVFGKIFAKELERRKEYADRLAERLPLTDCDLFYSLDHAYHHLNFAWNCRRATEERARACATADFVRWSRFPKGAPFLDLQPLPRRAKGPPREAGIALVRPSCSLHAHVQMAVRDLGLLCNMATVAVEEGGSLGQKAGVGAAEGFCEESFGRRLHRVYGDMNMVWGSRRNGERAVARRTCRRWMRFPWVFVVAAERRL